MKRKFGKAVSVILSLSLILPLMTVCVFAKESVTLGFSGGEWTYDGEIGKDVCTLGVTMNCDADFPMYSAELYVGFDTSLLSFEKATAADIAESDEHTALSMRYSTDSNETGFVIITLSDASSNNHTVKKGQTVVNLCFTAAQGADTEIATLDFSAPSGRENIIGYYDFGNENHTVISNAQKDVTVKGVLPTIDRVELSKNAASVDASVGDEIYAKAYSACGTDITELVKWDISGSGVSIAKDGKITIDACAENGERVVKASAMTDKTRGEDKTESFTVTRGISKVSRVAFENESERIPCPASAGSNSATFAAVLYDQYGDVMTGSVEYSLESEVTGFSLSGNTVSVTKEALGKSVKLVASCAGKSASVTVYAVGLEFVLPTVTAKGSYGQTLSDMVTIVGGSASLLGKTVVGTFFVENGNTYPNAGNYTARVLFSGGDYENVFVCEKSFTVDKAENSVKDLHIESWVYGEEPKTPYATALYDGDRLEFCYSQNEDDGYILDVPTEAGSYYMMAVVEEGDNVLRAFDKTTFEIKKAEAKNGVSKTFRVFYKDSERKTVKIDDFTDFAFQTAFIKSAGMIGGYGAEAIDNYDKDGFSLKDGLDETVIGKTAEFDVVIESTNFEDTTAKVVIEFIGKKTVNVTLADAEITYGDTYEPRPETDITAQPENFKYSYKKSSDAEFTDGLPTNAGEYVIKVVYEDDEYEGDIPGHIGETTAKLVIGKKKITVTPKSGQKKGFGDPDPVFTYNLSQSVATTGRLAREAGEEIGTYALSLGTLAPVSENYTLSLASQTVYFTIGKATAKFSVEPTIKKTLKYDGTDQKLITAGESADGVVKYSKYETYGYSDAIPTGKNAQLYRVFCKIIGDESHSDSEPIELRVKIEKADNRIFDLKISDWKYGESAKAPSAEALFGSISYSYSESRTGSFSSTAPKKVGTYYVKASVAGTDNYKAASDILEFHITKAAAPQSSATYSILYTDSSEQKLKISDFSNLSKLVNPKIVSASGLTGDAKDAVSSYSETSFKLKNVVSVNLAGKSAQYTVVITSDSHEDVTATVNIKLTKNDNPIGPIGPGGGGATETEKFTLSFETNGGTQINPVRKEDGSVVELALYTSIKSGYDFDGWYLEPTFKTKVTSVMLAKDMTVYAKWVTNTAALGSRAFIDVEVGSWYDDPIDYVVKNGIMKGMTENIFEPNTTINRASIVTMLHRLDGAKTTRTTNSFSDVESGSWYEAAVNWSLTNEIVLGYDSHTFGPYDPITREQLAAILYRYAVSCGMGYPAGAQHILDMNDAQSVSAWAYEAVCYMTENGVIMGRPGKIFDPAGIATRAEAATMFMRFMKLASGASISGK